MSRLIPDLENIVSEYLDVHDYAKLINLKPKQYSWEKYFRSLRDNGEDFPDIYQAIDIYDNLDLIKYLDTDSFNYMETGFYSIQTAEYFIKKYKPIYCEYTYIIRSSIYLKNLELFEYLIGLEIYPLNNDAWYNFLNTSLYTRNLEIIESINNKVMKKVDLSYYKSHISSQQFIGLLSWVAGDCGCLYFKKLRDKLK